MYKCCYGLLLALFLYACEGREMFCLRQAEELAESNPELALKHLDSVKSPAAFGKNNLLNYYFLKCHATFMRDGRLDDFFPSEEAARYWEKQGDAYRAAYVWLYNGIMTGRRFTRDETALYLDRAKTCAERQQDSLLLFYVHYFRGRLYFRNREFSEGKMAFQQALDYHADKPSRNRAHYWLKVAACALNEDDYVMAENCYRRMWECVITRRDSLMATRDLFHALRHVRQAKVRGEVLHHLEEELQDDFHTQVSYRLVKIASFIRERQLDSAGMMMAGLPADTLREMPDLLLQYYRLRGRYYVRLGDFEQATAELRKYIRERERWRDGEHSRRFSQIVAEYTQEKLEHEVHLLRVHRQRLVLGIIVLLLLSAGVIGWMLARRKEKLLEAERLSETLQELYRFMQEKQSDAKTVLMHELAVTRELARLAGEAAPRNKTFIQMYDELLGDIYPSELEWGNFYKLIDGIFDNFHIRLKDKYPDLTEKEIQLACLLKGELRTAEIAVVMKTSVAMILKRKSQLRKKLNLGDRTDIALLLSQSMEN